MSANPTNISRQKIVPFFNCYFTFLQVHGKSLKNNKPGFFQKWETVYTIKVFHKHNQYKNDNIANFVLAYYINMAADASLDPDVEFEN